MTYVLMTSLCTRRLTVTVDSAWFLDVSSFYSSNAENYSISDAYLTMVASNKALVYIKLFLCINAANRMAICLSRHYEQ